MTESAEGTVACTRLCHARTNLFVLVIPLFRERIPLFREREGGNDRENISRRVETMNEDHHE